MPTTLSASESDGGGLGVQMTFRRVIVWPNGQHHEIEDVTPKALPAPEPDSCEGD